MMMAKEISRLLSQRTEDIARYLLPNGKIVGNEWRAGSISGEAGQSLGVHLTGEKSGIWCDFENGDGGDLLDLWAKTQNLTLPEAIKEAIHYLGISMPHFQAYKSPTFAKPQKNNIVSLQISSPVMRYLNEERGLRSETISAYKIGGRGQQIIFPYWRNEELIFLKYLSLERFGGKKQIVVEPNCEPCLFGWHLIPPNTRSITLCEGEIDAMSLYQYSLPALSVPFGGGGGNKQKWLEYEFDRLAIFDEIYLCFDNDTEGQMATHELVERLGRHRCRIVKLPYKDANECLTANVTKETIDQCFKVACSLDPEELKPASQFIEQVIEEFYPPPGKHLGYYAPWEKTQGKILFRPGELSLWTGINGHGKSQFIGQVILHAMLQGARVCIASLELSPKRLLMRLTRQAGALKEPSVEYIRAIHEWYEDKLWLFDLVGTAKSKRLLEVFLYARQRYGIDIFVIDSFMKLDIAEDDFKAQKALMEQLCDFKNQHNCHIHLIAHPRKGADESQPPGKLDNKGTGAISDLADNCYTVWRNKLKEQLSNIQANGKTLSEKELKTLESSDCLWCCDKQRNGDWEGRFGFWFHAPTLQYIGSRDQKPQRVVEYSRTRDI
ncbi:TPA: AAA family ATPase [Legionella pneumophila subsp. pneumophila]|nr:AAA family ATPase [Legionella pneumophila subsp. pneumophila]HAT9262339.1 AAA family ATPase [Legionella pneumophila subsp. pneumophila]HAT9283613.1 AAA family ATPase [Legionella pneumophila subsp. pneumophila]HAT9289866.1 AAA family ATPase [Legionella pneumophila subsp. pneumophila]HAT9307174.1 AAA family ATPase [Legionella pneumophila subsp. pneumophila]